MSSLHWGGVLVGAVLAMTPGPALSAADAPATPEAIVDAQLEAYNRRDVEAFLAFYSDDAVLLRHPDKVTQTGKAEMRARYQRSFANKEARAQILERITFGRFVIDHERIVAPGKDDIVAVAIYEIRDGKIVRVTFLDP